jgi:hypothetical protein
LCAGVCGCACVRRLVSGAGCDDLTSLARLICHLWRFCVRIFLHLSGKPQQRFFHVFSAKHADSTTQHQPQPGDQQTEDGEEEEEGVRIDQGVFSQPPTHFATHVLMCRPVTHPVNADTLFTLQSRDPSKCALSLKTNLTSALVIASGRSSLFTNTSSGMPSRSLSSIILSAKERVQAQQSINTLRKRTRERSRLCGSL